ncbi:tetratricopeptide repeat protein [Comamonadaceae bacterium PP-2]
MATPRRDPLGQPHDALGRAAEAVDGFVLGFIACDLRVIHVLDEQDDASAAVQICLAMLHLFAESPAGALQARLHLSRAQAALAAMSPSHPAHDRLTRWAAATQAWCNGDTAQALALHETQVRRYPRDLLALKLGQYHAFNRGDAPAMLRLALPGLDAAADVPQLHGMAAFAYEQCHFLDAAEVHARQALAMRRDEPWAQHALAHVMLARGELHAGSRFLAEMSDGWSGLNSFMRTHNWWHLALFLIEQDHLDEALSLYDREVWGVDTACSQDQVNAVSLLARLELAGADVGERWQNVADHLVTRTADQVLPFLDMQYLYGLARAARPEADTLLQHVARRAQSVSSVSGGESDTVWREVAQPACLGLTAHARGDMREAAMQLGIALPRLQEIGGSHAQRELFEQLHLDALLRAGSLAGAQNLLQQRLALQPESVRLRKQARRLYAALALPTTLADPRGTTAGEPVRP